ncbi:Xanthine phosphoribosyltransferase 1 [Orbilia blumenaviensis]|uniref:Xanthine phosphoribosyltransferase 1 n=1 Tax=Orbilia blumenaviensis TaxID=1796055 RepID=A0AAV9VMI4_9PEZI
MDFETGRPKFENESSGLSPPLSKLRSSIQHLHHYISHKSQQALNFLLDVDIRFRSDYILLSRSLRSAPEVSPPRNYRKLLLLILLSTWGLVVGTYGVYVYDGIDILPSSKSWGREEVSKLLGPDYPVGKIISSSEWSTFRFGTVNIPAPPPEPPGSTVKKVQPPTDWLNCGAAKKFAKSLPEVTFVPFEEALEYNGEGQDIDWLNEWLTNGQINNVNLRPKSHLIDVIYTWVNGSSPAFHKAKQAVESESRLINIPGYATDTLNRHRDWDELRYSLRGVETFLNRDDTGELRTPKVIGKISIITTRHNDGTGDCQTPLWLNTTHPGAPEIIPQESLVSPMLIDTCANQTFSSCAVEARLDRLQSDNDKVMILSDDMFLSSQHSAADIYSPLYGLPFVFEYTWPHFTIDYPPAFGPLEFRFGEHPYLYLCAYLLHVRFGWEYRSYNKHTVHSLSRTIMRELRSTFPSAFELSSAQRFRGESPSIHLWFLFDWYVIERHREALIWSYLFGKLQADGSKTLNIKRLRARLLAIDTSTEFFRTSLLSEKVQSAYKNADIETNIASHFLWSSADGPVWLSAESERDIARRLDEALLHNTTFDEARKLAPCQMKTECFEFAGISSDDIPTEVIFDRWRKTERGCGDCMINALLRASGPVGLSAFLSTVPSKRRISLQSIYRYSHTFSRVDARYGMMESPQMVKSLTEEWSTQRPAEVCFNDHFLSDKPSEIQSFAEVAKDFFERYFSRKNEYEL